MISGVHLGLGFLGGVGNLNLGIMRREKSMFVLIFVLFINISSGKDIVCFFC